MQLLFKKNPSISLAWNLVLEIKKVIKHDGCQGMLARETTGI